MLTLGIIVIFRKVIQPALFVNSYQRDEITKVFEFKRVIFVAVCAVKLFFRDIFEGIWKGILNLKKLHILEILLALIISSVVYKVFAGYDFKSRMQELKKLSIISFISILLGLSIFSFHPIFRPFLDLTTGIWEPYGFFIPYLLFQGLFIFLSG